jgi:hypothetical protein
MAKWTDADFVSVKIEKLIAQAKNAKGKTMLTAIEMDYMEMLDYADRQAQGHPAASDATMVNFIVHEYGCDKRTAAKVWQDAKYFHSSAFLATKEYEKRRMTALLWNLIEEIKASVEPFQLVEPGDEEAKKKNKENQLLLPQLQKDAAMAIAKITEQIIKLNGYDKDEVEINKDDLKPHTFILSSNPMLLEGMTNERIEEIDEAVDRIIERKMRKQDVAPIYLEEKK